MSAEELLLDGAILPYSNESLIGYDAVLAGFIRSYRENRLHHALLFQGLEGIGKTTLAFHLARYILNNPNYKTADIKPSNTIMDSHVSRTVSAGACVDITYLIRPTDEKTEKLKSVITIDEVRKVGHFLAQTSGNTGWRIVIVDAVNDLNKSSANALLKMLEEPPEKTQFILIHHAGGRLLPTIRSRCVPVDLPPLTKHQVIQVLDMLGVSDGQDPEVISALAELANGSVTKALVLLRYGGMEIAEMFEQIMMDGPQKGSHNAFKIADTLSGKGRDILFNFFCGHAYSWLMRSAQKAIKDNDLTLANEIAEYVSEFEEDKNTMLGYNLDKKQFILSLFSSLHELNSS